MVDVQLAIEAPYQVLYSSKSGTDIMVHPLTYDAPDFDENLKDARDLANSRVPVKQIQILPYLHKYPELKQHLIPDSKEETDPDFRIDDVLVDAKNQLQIQLQKIVLQTLYLKHTSRQMV